MAAAVDDRDDDVPVVLPGLRFGRGYRLLGLIKRYWRAIVTNTFMNGRLRRSDAFAAGKLHVEPPSPSSFTSLDHLVGAGEQRRRHVERDSQDETLRNIWPLKQSHCGLTPRGLPRSRAAGASASSVVLQAFARVAIPPSTAVSSR